MNVWTTEAYAPSIPIDVEHWPPVTGELWRCETCPRFTRAPWPPWGNSGTCAELQELGLDPHVTIPGSCVIENRLDLREEHRRRMEERRRND